MVVTVNVKSLELQQELLQDALGLEGDDAVLVPLVAALEDDTVHRPGDVRHESPLLRFTAQLTN